MASPVSTGLLSYQNGEASLRDVRSYCRKVLDHQYSMRLYTGAASSFKKELKVAFQKKKIKKIKKKMKPTS